MTEKKGYIFVVNRQGNVHITWSERLGIEDYLIGKKVVGETVCDKFGISAYNPLIVELRNMHGKPFDERRERIEDIFAKLKKPEEKAAKEVTREESAIEVKLPNNIIAFPVAAVSGQR